MSKRGEAEGRSKRRRAIAPRPARISISRRRFAAAFAVCAVIAPSLAQDPRTTSAQLAARQWLTFADSLDAATSHQRSGAKFKTAMPLSAWTAALRRERETRGAVLGRTMVSTGFRGNIPGQPEGDYVLILFRTQFAKGVGSESVTLEREGDGVWRVVGYVIR